MQKKFNYQNKNVHDIHVDESFVRLWHHGGGYDKKCILKTFHPLLKSSFVYPYVALMPDFHQSGKNMVGSVIPTRQVILPSVIGNDMGCGMLGVKLPFSIHNKSSLQDLLSDLKKVIPVGRNQNETVSPRVKHNPLWHELDNVISIHKHDQGHLVRQFGSLGGGNHFLEILEDENGGHWILIHTGSRNTGAVINEFFITAGLQQTGVDKNLYRKIPYIDSNSPLAHQYLSDFSFAVRYAQGNRMEILLRAIEVLSKHSGDSQRTLSENVIDVCHNTISQEDHFGERLFLHRKGAMHLPSGSVGFVPGSMGTETFVVEGRGNGFAFHSCSHGAGRSMSRSEAIRTIMVSDFKTRMNGIVYDETVSCVDEAPPAYKNIRQVMRSQKDLVKILHKLNPVLSMKG